MELLRSCTEQPIYNVKRTSSNGNDFRITETFRDESNGSVCIPLTKNLWFGALMFSMFWAGASCWTSIHDASYFRTWRSCYITVVLWSIAAWTGTHGNDYASLKCTLCTKSGQNSGLIQDRIYPSVKRNYEISQLYEDFPFLQKNHLHWVVWCINTQDESNDTYIISQ